MQGSINNDNLFTQNRTQRFNPGQKTAHELLRIGARKNTVAVVNGIM